MTSCLSYRNVWVTDESMRVVDSRWPVPRTTDLHPSAWNVWRNSSFALNPGKNRCGADVLSCPPISNLCRDRVPEPVFLWMVSSCAHHVACLGRFPPAEPIHLQVKAQSISSYTNKQKLYTRQNGRLKSNLQKPREFLWNQFNKIIMNFVIPRLLDTVPRWVVVESITRSKVRERNFCHDIDHSRRGFLNSDKQYH